MPYYYFSEQLKGTPRNVATRIYLVPSEETLKRYPSAQPILISDLLGGVPKSSDITYTKWGEIEKQLAYKYFWDRCKEQQIVIEEYEAEFDEHNNIVHSHFRSEKERIKDYKTKEKGIEVTNREHIFTNEYDGSGKLVRRTDDDTYIVLMDGEKRWNRSYKTIDHYNEKGKLIERESDFDVLMFSYNEDLIASKKKYYSYEVYNLFEQGRKYERGYEVKYDYDTKGNLIRIIRNEPNGDVIPLEEMEYDKDNKLIRRLIKTHEGVKRIKYFDNRRVSISKGERNLSNPQKYIRYTIELLDTYNNVIGVYVRLRTNTYNPKKKLWVEDERFVSKDIFKYTYDANGNWTRKDYWHNGKNTYIVIREIDYYD